MKLGVLTVPYQSLPRREALEKIAALGVDCVELGTGNYPGSQHCDVNEMLGNESARAELRNDLAATGLFVSALSCHGNPLHPDEATAKRSHDTWRSTAQLAHDLEIPVVNLFSGCPGDHAGARSPNWVTCAWPEDFAEILRWQWEECLIPYWKAEAELASSLGIKIAFEMHPGFCVYNPETLLRLRAEAGPAVGANFDPSHLYWQGIDPVEAIRALGAEDAIFHVHAKDTYVDPVNVRVNGVLDTKDYGRVLERAWSFRTVGYGHDESSWRDQLSALRMVGYDYVLSIEHEDALMSIDEGLAKAVAFLQPLLLRESPAQMWWA
jgi:sugar phosphate isomerase/epimerase